MFCKLKNFAVYSGFSGYLTYDEAARLLRGEGRNGNGHEKGARFRTGRAKSHVRGTTIWSSEIRVYGGCLGVYWRRRPRQAAKSGGEEHTS